MPLDSGLHAVVERYDAYGPLLAAFLANLLATFGDKGQLVVLVLASKYDAKKVFAGAVSAFAVWSAIEVTVGSWITHVVPGSLMTLLTGGLFLVFGLWTLYSAARDFHIVGEGSADGVAVTEGGYELGTVGRFAPDRILEASGAYGGLVVAFVFIAFAEFGDKTQLLTINLAATFPNAPLAVYVGVLSALALRTGIDTFVGARFEGWVPSRWLELVSSAVFVVFGLVVFGILPELAILVLLGLVVLGLVGRVAMSLR
ncbi:MAG: TMEM165/GDT1 family protein [Halapricum sp.]